MTKQRRHIMILYSDRKVTPALKGASSNQKNHGAAEIMTISKISVSNVET